MLLAYIYVHLKCNMNYKTEKMPFKTRTNLGNKSWKMFHGKRMPGSNKSMRHAVAFSLGKSFISLSKEFPFPNLSGE